MKLIIMLITLVLFTGCIENKHFVDDASLKGADGSSCTTKQMSNGALIECTDGSISVIINGANGAAGVNGSNGTNGIDGTNGSNGQNASGIYITEVINPCGAEFANEEVFLRLSNGTILALYDGGANLDRLALLTAGNYVTTDSNGHSCSFTVNNQMQLTNQVRH